MYELNPSPKAISLQPASPGLLLLPGSKLRIPSLQCVVNLRKATSFRCRLRQAEVAIHVKASKTVPALMVAFASRTTAVATRR